MKRLSFFTLIFALGFFFIFINRSTPNLSAKTPDINLMPYPAKISFGQSKLAIDAEFRVALTGYKEPRLERAVHRMIKRLSAQTGIALAFDIEKEGIPV